MTKALPALLLAALLLPACGRAPLAAGPRPAAAPAARATSQATTRAALTGTLGDEPVRVAIHDGTMRVTLGDAVFEGTHGFFDVAGTLRAPDRPDRALAVRMEGGKLVGEIDGVALKMTARKDAENQQRVLDGVWGERSFTIGFKTQPDAKLQLRFEGPINGRPALIQGSGPWQGEQFAVYTSLFVLLAFAP